MNSVRKYKIVAIKISDANNFFDLVQNNRESFARYFPHIMKGTNDLKDTNKLNRYRINLEKKNIQYYYSITLKSNKQFIECISLREFNWEISSAKIGFFIDREFKGRGIASAALKAMVKYGFKEKKLNKLILRIGAENKACKRVAAKNGIKLEGVLKTDYKTYYNVIVNIAYYNILVAD
ncbi:MAG: GNAT family N-acetyltransferase [Saprospiraceae bacterium]|nr:GNAT family N-acetyltransferase [Saprospiraceae bacterium]